jgi:hypothetical protein
LPGNWSRPSMSSMRSAITHRNSSGSWPLVAGVSLT